MPESPSEPTPVKPEAPKPELESKWSFWKSASLKEFTSTTLAVLIVLLNITVFVYILTIEKNSYSADVIKDLGTVPSDAKGLIALLDGLADARFSRVKDILMVATSFLGVVLGYYFGRIPAERALEKAEQNVESAKVNTETAQQNAADATAAKNDQAATSDATLKALKKNVDKLDVGDGSGGFKLESANGKGVVQSLQSTIDAALAKQ